ncbi:BolA family protein [Dongia deserti]|uniref:BolA family protein n=1 Tax=Dongia deserti TaxID=2268030 RepID=UPI002AC317E8|nr:BolA family protein [Dongia deserti]
MTEEIAESFKGCLAYWLDCLLGNRTMVSSFEGRTMGQVADRIERKLRMAFQPESLDVIDETNQHHGHAGWRESGETHFRVEIIASAFAGKSRVERQRAVYEVLAEELAGPVHALALTANAPAT